MEQTHMTMVRVVALERGHDGEQLREPGAEFDVLERLCLDGSTWLRPADPVVAEHYAKLTCAQAPRIAKANAEAAGARLQAEFAEQFGAAQ